MNQKKKNEPSFSTETQHVLWGGVGGGFVPARLGQYHLGKRAADAASDSSTSPPSAGAMQAYGEPPTGSQKRKAGAGSGGSRESAYAGSPKHPCTTSPRKSTNKAPRTQSHLASPMPTPNPRAHQRCVERGTIFKLRVGYSNSGIAIASHFDRIEIGQFDRSNRDRHRNFMRSQC